MNFNNVLIIDIETVPALSSYNLLTPAWQELWAYKASKLTSSATLSPASSYDEQAGIYAEFGKIVCITLAYFITSDAGHLQLKHRTIYNHNEVLLLNDFILVCDSFAKAKKGIQFAGHNIKEFDIPYICRRLIINHIAIPKYLNIQGQKPWETNQIDTLHWWRFGDYKNYTSLHLLATALGVATSKQDMDGSQVRDVYYNHNDLERISNYCALDVLVVAQVLLRYQNLPLLEEQDCIKV